GGWPQVWPLQGGYHDSFTINDNAIVEVAELLDAIAAGREQYAFVPPTVRERAQVAEKRAIAALLATQVVVAGRRSLWGQQHDALTLAPTSARNYEPAALCSSESASILVYLMTLPTPSQDIVEAIEGGIAALRALGIEGKAWRKVSELDGRLLVSQPGAPTVWARYYDITTLQPVFGDRDKSLHDNVADLSLERRNGYAWYGVGPVKALEAYAVWKQRRAQVTP
ncbi:MAG: pectate lyase, partial [Burkholderiales bacterium PBB4]